MSTSTALLGQFSNIVPHVNNSCLNGPVAEHNTKDQSEDTELMSLQQQLLNIPTERRKAVIRKQIAEERTRIDALSQPPPATLNPTANPGTTPVPAVQQGEQITEPLCQNPTGGILIDLDTTKPNKVLQIINFLWLDPVAVNTYSFGLEFRIGRKRSLENVSVEEWGYANTRILQELMKLDPGFHPTPYLKYTADIFPLAGKYVWYSVLLYDKEYRERQAIEKFEWGTCLQDLRKFRLIIKKDHPTALPLQEQNLAHKNTKPVGYGKPSSNSNPTSVRRKGPFTSEGREIFRNFNNMFNNFKRM
ncbi:hypothetical protein LOTGIDRAFT_155061 [Lottia gigantea]|uniref:Uncharacterized protein n=1 Tax=Lottia gigantea TaxID=225164 RepID=V3Z4G7_LOTGI|nr:hypothetical protein LOTGIDRAFT_155061 [Lottia gigantea]ESO85573.1 hypothetical protein LOTGIDRAFT_155061 [Lottia gigantea]